LSMQSHGDAQVVTCPHCDGEGIYAISRNVNGSWKPEYREKIMDGSLHRVNCIHCGEQFFIDVPLHYCDFDRSEWFMMYPLAWEPQWRRWANDVNVSYGLAYAGPETPPILRSKPPQMMRRAVFGLPALREKLVLHEAGIDDVSLEAFKMHMLLENQRTAPLPEYRPRCVAVDDKNMLLSQWIDGGDELKPAAMTISRADVLAAQDMLRDTAIVAQLQSSPYVDLGAIMYANEPADA